MNNLIAAATLLTAILAAPAFADVSVRDIVINQSAKTAAGTNIRVVMDAADQNEQISGVDLQVRENASSEWHTLKSWDKPMRILAGDKLALDYLPLSEDKPLDPALTMDSFELRATIHGPSGDVVSQAVLFNPDVNAATR